jgi:CYTH domain-containing protein
VTSREATRPKYALAEVERRWLVDQAQVTGMALGAATRISDCYLDDSRLRLRRVEPDDGDVTFKLCKKYGDFAPGAESITNLYLSATEYALLATLPGWVVEKLRYRWMGGSLDHYQRLTSSKRSDDLWVFERELIDLESAGSFVPPGFVTREITADANFTGATLARRFGTLSTP